jgi:hypothetical protein
MMGVFARVEAAREGSQQDEWRKGISPAEDESG